MHMQKLHYTVKYTRGFTFCMDFVKCLKKFAASQERKLFSVKLYCDSFRYCCATGRFNSMRSILVFVFYVTLFFNLSVFLMHAIFSLCFWPTCICTVSSSFGCARVFLPLSKYYVCIFHLLCHFIHPSYL